MMSQYRNDSEVPYIPKVHIVIVNWNGWKNTIECLESVFRSDYSNYQVIICDNDSQDGSLSQIKAWANGLVQIDASTHTPLRNLPYAPISKPIWYIECNGSQMEFPCSLTGSNAPLILVKTGANLGFAGGNNIGIRAALGLGADYIWLLNNDTVVEHTAISKMVETMRCMSGIIGSIIRYYAEPDKVQAYGGGYISCLTGRVWTQHKQTSKSLGFILGASLMLDRATLHRVGFLDESLFMYFEEVEYCLRARNRGVRLAVSEATVYHKGGASSPSSYFSWKNVYENKVCTMLKHCGLGLWIPCTLLMWLINVLNSRIDAGKRRASREACLYLLKSVFGRYRRSDRVA